MRNSDSRYENAAIRMGMGYYLFEAIGFRSTRMTESPLKNILLMYRSLLTGLAFFLPEMITYMINKSTRHAHFSHFSREREMVLRDISREKCGARNCEKNRPIFGHFGPQFGQNSSNFQCRVTQIELKVLHQLISYDFVN